MLLGLFNSPKIHELDLQCCALVWHFNNSVWAMSTENVELDSLKCTQEWLLNDDDTVYIIQFANLRWNFPYSQLTHLWQLNFYKITAVSLSCNNHIYSENWWRNCQLWNQLERPSGSNSATLQMRWLTKLPLFFSFQICSYPLCLW